MALLVRSISNDAAQRIMSLSRCPVFMTKFNSIPATVKTILQFNRGHKRWVRHVRMAFKNRKDKFDAKRIEPLPPQPRNTYAEWNHNAEIFAFGKRLGENFNKDLLQQAFVERSYIIMEEEKQKKVGIEDPKILLKDNVEFAEKGELLISSYAKRYLRIVYPKIPEEGICSIADYLLSDNVLADISKSIGTTDIILTSDNPPTIKSLANVLKAVIHALEMSSGEEKAYAFIRDFIITYLSGKDLNDLWKVNDPECVLALILQRDGRSPVEPRIIGEAGKGTILAAFQIGLYSNKELIGKGFGESISIAKEMAAMDALKRLFQTTECSKPIPFNLVLKPNNSEPFANLSIQDWCEKNIQSLVTQR